VKSGLSDPLPSHLRWTWVELAVHAEHVAVVPVLTGARTRSTNSNPS
jgi:hypothetical protein